MPTGVGSLLGMLLAVVAILALAWWVTSLIARQGTLALPGPAAAGGAGELCVLRQIPISRTERLLLVRLNQRCLLLGAAQGGVTLLAELTEEESQIWLGSLSGQSGGSAGADFRRFLHSSTKK